VWAANSLLAADLPWEICLAEFDATGLGCFLIMLQMGSWVIFPWGCISSYLGMLDCAAAVWFKIEMIQGKRASAI